MRDKVIFLVLLLVSSTLAVGSFLLPAKRVVAQQSIKDWWNPDWGSRRVVVINETAGLNRVNEPTDVEIAFDPGKCLDPVKEVRVVQFDGSAWTEVPSQVYNVTMAGGYAQSANVVFLANVSAYSSTTYQIYYNAAVEAPTYDGLRLHTEIAGDTYNVTAVKDGVEKIYFRIYWKHAITLYSDGKNITLSGGQPGWELFTISFANLWTDADDAAWFSCRIGETLKVTNSGPIFVDFENTQPIASDLWGSVFNSNISSIYRLRVYYQPDLNPLVRYCMSLTWKNVETVNNILFMDFKLANDTSTQVSPGVWEEGSYAIYKDFTWKNTDGVVQTVPVETTVTDLIWNPANPVGWWSYNGNRSDSTMKPGADIGMIPTYTGGTISGSDYTIEITQQIEYNDNHASPYVKGTYGGNTSDTVETIGYLVVNTPTDQNVAPTMEDEATKLRNPLEHGRLPVYNVNTGLDYATIQGAIDANETLDGNTILVSAGTYYENVVVNKSVSLVGENKSTTIIDGNMTGTTVYVTASNVEITEFTIRNGIALRSGFWAGVWISFSENNTISGNVFSSNFCDIFLNHSSGNTISGNTMAYGIYLRNSNDNAISGNELNEAFSGDLTGISLIDSSSNTIIGNTVLNFWVAGISVGGERNIISENTISNSEHGLQIQGGAGNNKVVDNTISDNYNSIELYNTGAGNTFYHNNIINSKVPILSSGTPVSWNTWDNGAEGNYWSDYNGTDTNGDGIGDTLLPHLGVDSYPLMGMYSDFAVEYQAQTEHVTTICNSTISDFQCYYDSEIQSNVLRFNVSGAEGTTGFCRITIPHALVAPGYNVTINNGSPIQSKVLSSDTTQTTLYFTYHHTTKQVKITIPEFPSALILLLLMAVTLVAVLVEKLVNFKKEQRKPTNYEGISACYKL